MDHRARELLVVLADHQPVDTRERRSLSRTRALLSWLPAPFDQTADPTHATASAIVLDDDDRVVLHRHKRLGRWLQPGGHVDGDETPAEAAIRETLEETGLVARHPGGEPRLVHVDVHQGPRSHVHLDLRYVLITESTGGFSPDAGESREVAWWSLDEVVARSDPGLVAAVMNALRRR